MVIVSVTRDDLRDEYMMADEAFALSPISARAMQPREEDYDAIREAFMETSRGRWFLGEYAKRNRNADTSMVLDAVARIEENIAAQMQPAPDNGLAEALIAIRGAVEEARAAASVAIDGLALEETLTPVRKGARVIREIAWRWREIGADGRICDLLDSQVSAIEASCGQIASIDPSGALSAAFDLIEEQIAELGVGDTASPQVPEAAVRSPSPSSSRAASDERPAADLEMVQAAPAANDPEAAMSIPAMPAEAVVAAGERAEVAEQTPDAQTSDAETSDADDDAVLDMVALEMAAPDPFDIDDPVDTDTDEIHVAEEARADPEVITRMPEPQAPPIIQPSLQPSPEPSLQPSPEPSLEHSLGSTLIANGILRKPHASESDPLAPIRRMSQAEKIAFFS
jgi:hypothetical protein